MSAVLSFPDAKRRDTEIGIEALCSKCKEWWPEDQEFFYRRSDKSRFHSQCKACMYAGKSARRSA